MALHLLAVIGYRLFKNENLVSTMITGDKPAEYVNHQESIVSSRLLLAGSLLMLVIGLLVWLVKHAPEPADLSFM